MDGNVGGGTVLAILHGQHARLRELLSQVADGSGPDRRRDFDALLQLLAVHEAAEDFVLRPAGRSVVSRHVAAARAGEERQIAQLLAGLETLDLDGEAFAKGFAAFTETLVMHLWFEEAEEWPALETRWSEEQQLRLGAWVERGLALDTSGPDTRFSVLLEQALDRLAECRDEPPRYFDTVQLNMTSSTQKESHALDRTIPAIARPLPG